MKRIILLASMAAVFLAPAISKAQYTIPNGSFEDWQTSTQPKNWAVVSGSITKNAGVQYTKTPQGGTAQNLFRPAKNGIACIGLQNVVVGGVLNRGVIKDSFPFTGKPANFSMNYAYFSASGEICGAVIVMTKWNTTTGKRDTILSTAVGSDPGPIEPWSTLTSTTTSLSAAYKTGTPDTCRIFLSSTLLNQSTPTTITYIDQIWFSDDAIAGVDLNIDHNATGINAYPNPFTGQTTIHYNLTENGQVSLKVYDIAGKEVAVLADENQISGSHDVTFDASSLTNGVYFYRLQAGASTQSGKLILSK